jgi:fused signal recognition particle receptor
MFNFFKSKIKKISQKLLKLKSDLGVKIKSLFSEKNDSSALLELEKLLYEADLGVATSMELVEKVESSLKKRKDLSPEEIIQLIKTELLNILEKDLPIKEVDSFPCVILVVGVNGSGKTTSIAKLANFYKTMDKKVLIAAADTFRAAAVEQLSSWAEVIGVDIIKSQQGADPASIVYDALAAAKARKIDIVLIDTAGRLQSKSELMEELGKIKRVCQKQIESAPHRIYLTLDATTGQNALDQAKIFNQFTPITGIILAKADGSAKGGIVVAIKKELNIPVIWAGIGEKIDDIIPFDPKAFVDELLSFEE